MINLHSTGISAQQLGRTSDSLNTSVSSNESAKISLEQKNEQGQTLRVSASYSNSVTISGQTSRSQTFAANGVHKYEAIGDQAPTSKAASNILGFIAQKIERELADGATTEQLQERLSQGLEGFLKGFGEAYDILKQSDLLSPEVEEAITQTYNNVLAGVNELADNYGLESPVMQTIGEGGAVAADVTDTSSSRESSNVGVISSNSSLLEQSPADAFAALASDLSQQVDDLQSLLDSTMTHYEGTGSRDFSFNLKTRDGDVVTITASSTQSESSGNYTLVYGNDSGSVSASGFAVEQNSSSAFSLSVDGELDEDELAAIGDLLGQIGDLSATFFSGNVSEAFDMALNVGFDSDEIARFSLNLKQETYTKVENTYRDVGKLGQNPAAGEPRVYSDSSASRDEPLTPEKAKLEQLARFVQILEDARNNSNELGLGDKFITKFTGYIEGGHAGESTQTNELTTFTLKMLDQLNKIESTEAQG